jgi:hypothetical protein
MAHAILLGLVGGLCFMAGPGFHRGLAVGWTNGWRGGCVAVADTRAVPLHPGWKENAGVTRRPGGYPAFSPSLRRRRSYSSDADLAHRETALRESQLRSVSMLLVPLPQS